jgi:hypothetical protein
MFYACTLRNIQNINLTEFLHAQNEETSSNIEQLSRILLLKTTHCFESVGP